MGSGSTSPSRPSARGRPTQCAGRSGATFGSSQTKTPTKKLSVIFSLETGCKLISSGFSIGYWPHFPLGTLKHRSRWGLDRIQDEIQCCLLCGRESSTNRIQEICNISSLEHLNKHYSHCIHISEGPHRVRERVQLHVSGAAPGRRARCHELGLFRWDLPHCEGVGLEDWKLWQQTQLCLRTLASSLYAVIWTWHLNEGVFRRNRSPVLLSNVRKTHGIYRGIKIWQFEFDYFRSEYTVPNHTKKICFEKRANQINPTFTHLLLVWL